MLEKINDKVVLVTGAGSGFGKAIVEKCLDEGVTVLAACHHQQSLEELNKEFKNKRGQLKAFTMDITSAESIQAGLALVEKTLKETGKDLHALINNAGIRGKLFVDAFMTIDDYKDAIDVNTYGPIRVTHAFQQLIKKSKTRLIYCVSGSTMFQAPSIAPYTVSKSALDAYASCIRHEMLPFGVKVITVQPGVFRTNLNAVTKVLKETEEVWMIPPESKRKRVYVDVVEMSPTDITPVVDAYFQALFAKYPRLNYIVGKDAKLIFLPYSYLPTQIQVWIMSQFQKFFNTPIPAITDTD
uniref:NAD(P)-binding protein n=1 Tax=Syphacia muris TaxID=451379 RepID=A0A0N5AIM4_9BILA